MARKKSTTTEAVGAEAPVKAPKTKTKAAEAPA